MPTPKRGLKRTVKRTITRRRPMVSRRLGFARDMIGGQVYKFVRRTNKLGTQVITGGATETALTVVVGTPQYRNFTFSVDHCPNFAEFSALFEYYKIDKVVCEFSTRNASSNYATTNQPSPIVYYSIDYNAASAPTSIDTIREKRNCKVVYMNDKNKRFFKVKLTPKYNESLGGNLSQPVNTGWYNMNTGTTAPFQGIIFAVELLGEALQQQILTYEVKYHLSFKGAQ